MRKSLLFILLITFWAILISPDSGGQPIAGYDTAYYNAYEELFTGRIYYSQKFTGFNVRYRDAPDSILKYRPNTSRNLGIGISHKGYTLNLAYGFGFMNKDRGQGDTRYLDLQSHLYLGQFNVDLYGQFYRGYYLENYRQDGEYYTRGDIRVNEIGLSVQKVVNHEEFSFRAAFQNTDYQKRSAGSWVIGANFFYGEVRGDSSFAPGFLNMDVPGYEDMHFFKAGPLAGYAYTFVVQRHYYFTASVNLSLNGGMYKLQDQSEKENEFFMSVDGGYRFALGYNSVKFNLGALYVLQRVHYDKSFHNRIDTGNFRVIAAYRFTRKL